MKLPQIQGIHKIRDARICRLWLEDNLGSEEIEATGQFNISSRQIRRILYKNREVLKLDREWEKQKRIHWLKRQIKDRGNSKKDSADLLEQLRKDIEGEKGIEFKQVINVGTNGKLTDEDRARQKDLLGKLGRYFQE